MREEKENDEQALSFCWEMGIRRSAGPQDDVMEKKTWTIEVFNSADFSFAVAKSGTEEGEGKHHP